MRNRDDRRLLFLRGDRSPIDVHELLDGELLLDGRRLRRGSELRVAHGMPRRLLQQLRHHNLHDQLREHVRRGERPGIQRSPGRTELRREQLLDVPVSRGPTRSAATLQREAGANGEAHCREDGSWGA